MGDPITSPQPKTLWKYFGTLLQTPRPSGNEELARSFVLSIAQDRGFPVQSDKAGNLVVNIPGSQGYEDGPIGILQGRLDTVCEKQDGVEHDCQTAS